ncbi:hypothetical protein Q9L58_010627, partial [Maublancomyces gigas]
RASDKWPPELPFDRLGRFVQEFREFLVQENHATECCSTCAQLVPVSELGQYGEDTPEVQLVRTKEKEHEGKIYFDRCGVHCDSGSATHCTGFDICSSCSRALKFGKLPRLSIANGLDVGCCPNIPLYLTGLSQLEEIVISRGRAFGNIIKLRAPGMSPDACYQRVKGHVV